MVISKAKQRLYVVRRFHALDADTKLVTQLYRTFIESKLMFAIFLYYPHMYSIQQNAMQSILNEATKHGANIQLSLDEAIKLRCQKYVLTIYRDETHLFIASSRQCRQDACVLLRSGRQRERTRFIVF